MQNSSIIYTASGCVRKNKKGVVMRTKDFVKMFAIEQTLQTKLGKRKAFVIHNPNELPKNVKDLIFNDFYSVALSAFNQNKSEAFEKDVYKHLFNVDGLVLIFHDDVEYSNGVSIEKGTAFRTFSMIGKDTMYVEGTAVDPNYQGQGFYQAFTKATINGCKFVVSRTQNPVVITALNKLFGNVAMITRRADKQDKQVAWQLSQKLGMEKLDKGFVGRGTYGKMLNGMLPKIKGKIRDKLYSYIDPMEGDCFIAVSRI